jgi:hypothetical protein
MKALITSAAAVALLCPTPALAATQADAKKWEIAFQAENLADAVVTSTCLHSGQCAEGNPLIGRHPSDAKLFGIKAAVGLVHFIAWKRLLAQDAKSAMRFSQISLVGQGTIVALNLRFVF